MEIKNIFNNIVCIGKFNPSILNLKFLKDNNIYNLEKELAKPTITPVMVNLKYDNFDFFIELERFQITERNIREDFKIDVIKIIYNYLKVLKFTPISVVGINFESDIMIDNSDMLINNLKNDEVIRKILNTEEFIYSPRIKKNKKKYEYLSWNIETLQSENEKLIKRINIRKQNNNKYRFSFNNELKNIKDYNDLSFFIENFEKIKNENSKIINNLFGDLNDRNKLSN